jgi:hypothetical protein
MRRVSYYQSLFDLLDLQPGASSEAVRMIRHHEAAHGSLPAAVRQWYRIDNVVGLRPTARRFHDHTGLWYAYSNSDHPEALSAVLDQFASPLAGGEPQRVLVLGENQGVWSWFIQPDGSDDPPVVVDEAVEDRPEGRIAIEWYKVSDRFSRFVFDWFAAYFHGVWRVNFPAPTDDVGDYPATTGHRNGLWLYAPEDTALAPPHLDFLIEHFTEDARREIEPGVMQYEFHDDNGRLRITTDDHSESDGVAAWWLAADDAEGLFLLARRVLWCGGLRENLRHWTKSARPVMDRLRAEGPIAP